MTPQNINQFSAEYEYRMCFDSATLCHNATQVAVSTCSQFSKAFLQEIRVEIWLHKLWWCWSISLSGTIHQLQVTGTDNGSTIWHDLYSHELWLLLQQCYTPNLATNQEITSNIYIHRSHLIFEYICTKQLCQWPEIFKPFLGQYHIPLLGSPSHNQSLHIKNYLHSDVGILCSNHTKFQNS